MQIENEDYELKDVICLLMDMFGKKDTNFYAEDLLMKPHLAFNFFNLLTNYYKCFDVLISDSNQSIFKCVMQEWIIFANKTYK